MVGKVIYDIHDMLTTHVKVVLRQKMNNTFKYVYTSQYKFLEDTNGQGDRWYNFLDIFFKY